MNKLVAAGGERDAESNGNRANAHKVSRWPAARKFVAFLSQISPTGPVLPAQPTNKPFAVNNLIFVSFHGMEEVIGSIPIRSTNKPNNLADSQKKRDTLSIRWFSCCILRSTLHDIPRTVQKNIDHTALRFALG